MKIFRNTQCHYYLPVLFEVVLSLETLPAHLTTERQLRTLVRPLVYHQIVTFSESALAVLAYELAFRTHLPAELSAAHVVLNLHYRKHRARLLSGTVAVNHLVFGNLDDELEPGVREWCRCWLVAGNVRKFGGQMMTQVVDGVRSM